MKEQRANVKELKEENAAIIGKAGVYTNTAYALIEAADTFMLNANTLLKKVHTSISKEEKQKLGQAIVQGKQFKTRLASMAKVLYKLDIAEEALDDSDELYDLMKLVVDRCGGDMKILQNIKETIKNSFESKYGYYETNR